jgi:hypothetical protein
MTLSVRVRSEGYRWRLYFVMENNTVNCLLCLSLSSNTPFVVRMCQISESQYPLHSAD